MIKRVGIYTGSLDFRSLREAVGQKMSLPERLQRLANSRDANAIALYNQNNKKPLIAYVLLGTASLHNIYLGRTKWAVAQIFYLLVALLIIRHPIAFVVLIVWVIVDAIRIPAWVEAHNRQLLDMLAADDSAPVPMRTSRRPERSR